MAELISKGVYLYSTWTGILAVYFGNVYEPTFKATIAIFKSDDGKRLSCSKNEGVVYNNTIWFSGLDNQIQIAVAATRLQNELAWKIQDAEAKIANLKTKIAALNIHRNFKKTEKEKVMIPEGFQSATRRDEEVIKILKSIEKELGGFTRFVIDPGDPILYKILWAGVTLVDGKEQQIEFSQLYTPEDFRLLSNVLDMAENFKFAFRKWQKSQMKSWTLADEIIRVLRLSLSEADRYTLTRILELHPVNNPEIYLQYNLSDNTSNQKE